MRYQILCTLALSLLAAAPACERANQPDDQHDAGIVRPPDDGGSAMPDARTSRPGAGPLDPDLTIPCEAASINVSKNPDTGAITSRFSILTATWTEASLPREAWVCTPNSLPFQTCGALGPERCEIQGMFQQRQCQSPAWYVTADGTYLALCGYRNESDRDGDGDIEPSEPDLIDAYLAIIR